MLSDTSKVPRFDFPVTNFFPQFTPCPQPAIVLNVNNMMNTGSVGNATNNTNANINTTTATNVVESNVQQTSMGDKEHNINKDVNKNVSCVTSEAMSLNVPVEAQIYKMAEHKLNEVLSVNETQSPAMSQQNMTTTTSISV
jgi:hypothetical protein